MLSLPQLGPRLGADPKGSAPATKGPEYIDLINKLRCYPQQLESFCVFAIKSFYAIKKLAAYAISKLRWYPQQPQLQRFIFTNLSEACCAAKRWKHVSLLQRLPDLLRHLLRNPIEPDLALHKASLNLTWLCTKASQTFSGTFSENLCTKASHAFSGTFYGAR